MPPPTPPRSTATKAQLSSSLNNAQPQSNSNSLIENTERQSPISPVNCDDLKRPPPRPQAPMNVMKIPESCVPEAPKKRNVKIPPPLQTQPLLEEDKMQLSSNDSSMGSSGIISMRQDSSLSSDSYSQNSSPSYTTKSMETPLLAQCGKKTIFKHFGGDKIGRDRNDICMGDSNEAVSNISGLGLDDANNAITKSHSTPASLQTVVRFHNGSTMSIHHRVSTLHRSMHTLHGCS